MATKKSNGVDQNTMRIWDSVQKTDPDFTKPLTQFGGKFTTVQTMYNCRRATELWGPVGQGWGTTVHSAETINGEQLDDKGTRSMLFVVMLSVWWRDEKDEVHDGIKQYGSALLLKKDRRGIVFDDEAPKKAMTDALGKSLSYFGFSADIYLGLWDDNKYIATIKQEKIEERKVESALKFQILLKEYKEKVKSATDVDALEEIWRASSFVRKECGQTFRDDMEGLFKSRKAEIKSQEKVATK
ncbi:MAG: hypothetical protein CME71_11690 [Halobacteriovorax sp.]|nr:hypothetical protein [Halobacteriovorax sp.]|tara:strand:+ start:5578 stop:6303 length:726 start_codon:yes stop_codon:yes gene_type:complete